MARIKYYDKETRQWKYADAAHGSQNEPGGDYILTDADKTEIAQLAAELVKVPDDDHINSLIDTKLGVIENGTY